MIKKQQQLQHNILNITLIFGLMALKLKSSSVVL